MKLIIAGGRSYRFTKEDISRLDRIHCMTPISEVVCGMASGADAEGASWAPNRGIAIKGFPADWRGHGKAAGPIRNREMAEYADAVALFAGGAGTESMRREAIRAGITIYDFTISKLHA